MDVSTGTTQPAWKVREKAATLVLAVAARRQAIMDRMLRYRRENARPEDRRGLLPQEEAAERADVRARQWQRWETGETVPHPANLERMAGNLGIPIEEFFGGEPKEMMPAETPDPFASANGDDPYGAKLDQILRDQKALRDQLDEVLEMLVTQDEADDEAGESSGRAARQDKGRPPKPPADARGQ